MTLLGMGRVFPGAVGVMDPVEARAAWVGTASTGALLLVVDTVFTKVLSPHQDDLIRELARRTGLRPAQVWLTCTHCHSSAGEAFDQTWSGGDHYRIRSFSAYLDWLLPRLVEVGVRAYRRRTPVEIGYAIAAASGVSGSRRIRTADGIALSAWACGPCPPPGVRPLHPGPHDPDVCLVVFRNRRQRPIGAWVNYSSHIHLYPTQRFSSELAGEVRRRLERQHPGLTAIYTNGAEGTTTLDAALAPQSSDPARWDGLYQRRRSAIAGRMLRAIDAAWKRLSFRRQVRMRCGTSRARMRIRDVDGRERELIQPLKAITIDDLAMVAEQEEAWCEFALDLKARSPFPITCVVGFVGSRNRYFPTAHGIEEGGYESPILFRDGDGFARTVDAAVALLRRLRRTPPR